MKTRTLLFYKLPIYIKTIYNLILFQDFIREIYSSWFAERFFFLLAILDHSFGFYLHATLSISNKRNKEFIKIKYCILFTFCYIPLRYFAKCDQGKIIKCKRHLDLRRIAYTAWSKNWMDLRCNPEHIYKQENDLLYSRWLLLHSFLCRGWHIYIESRPYPLNSLR